MLHAETSKRLNARRTSQVKHGHQAFRRARRRGAGAPELLRIPERTLRYTQEFYHYGQGVIVYSLT